MMPILFVLVVRAVACPARPRTEYPQAETGTDGTTRPPSRRSSVKGGNILRPRGRRTSTGSSAGLSPACIPRVGRAQRRAKTVPPHRPVRLHEHAGCRVSARVLPARDLADEVVVEAESEQRPVFPVGWRRRRPRLEDRLIARMLAPWLDGELARGLGTSLSEAHAARAEQLSTKRSRRALVVSLDRLVDQAENPRQGFFTGIIIPALRSRYWRRCR